MRSLLLSIGVLALTAGPALAQSGPMGPGPNDVVTGPPGLRGSVPLVHHPANLRPEPGQRIAAALPQPNLGPNAPASAYLRAARHALATNQLGLAQASLAQAETVLMNNPNNVRHPLQNPAVQNVQTALNAMAHGNYERTMGIVQHTIPMTEGMQARMEGPMQRPAGPGGQMGPSERMGPGGPSGPGPSGPMGR